MPDLPQKTKAALCLLAYFLIWMESAYALPLLFAVADHSHKAIVTAYPGEIHLSLHHPGNKDNHESPANAHGAIPTIALSGQDKHSDHEINVRDGAQFISPLLKKAEGAKNILPATMAQFPSTIINRFSTRLFPDFFSKTISPSVSPLLLI